MYCDPQSGTPHAHHQAQAGLATKPVFRNRPDRKRTQFNRAHKSAHQQHSMKLIRIPEPQKNWLRLGLFSPKIGFKLAFIPHLVKRSELTAARTPSPVSPSRFDYVIFAVLLLDILTPTFTVRGLTLVLPGMPVYFLWPGRAGALPLRGETNRRAGVSPLRGEQKKRRLLIERFRD
jgi:hypothetical protein